MKKLFALLVAALIALPAQAQTVVRPGGAIYDASTGSFLGFTNMNNGREERLTATLGSGLTATAVICTDSAKAFTSTCSSATPSFGATTVTSLNGNTITTGTGTLTLGTGSTLVTSGAFSTTLTSTATTNATLPAGSTTLTPLPTILEKAGTGAGAYTRANAAYGDVDATNLAYTVTIPTGWKLMVIATFAAQTSAASSTCYSIFDTSTVAEECTDIVAATAANNQLFSLSKTITGDGASHTVKLQYKSSVGTITMTNGSAANAPKMQFFLTQTN